MEDDPSEENQEEVRESWYLIKEEELTKFLQRSQDGENVDLILLEILANCDEENFWDDESDSDDDDSMYIHLNFEDDDEY